jgi:hypothetical protein
MALTTKFHAFLIYLAIPGIVVMGSGMKPVIPNESKVFEAQKNL